MSGRANIDRCPHCGRAAQVWSRPKIIAAAQKWAEEHGQPPKAHQWRKTSPYNPEFTTVANIFGSWNNMLIEAGLPLARKSPNVLWTKKDCADAIYRFKFEHGRLPRFHEMLGGMADRPSSHTMVRLYGSWTAVLQAAGYAAEEIPA